MPPPIHRTMTAAEWGLLLILSLLWGSSFLFNAVAVAALPPFTVVAGRVALGAALLYLAMRAFGSTRLPTDAASWRSFALMGLFNNVIPFGLIVWGQSYILSGLASILNATTPMFTLLVAHALTNDERMTPARVGGMAIGFLGVVVLVGVDALGEASEHLLAELAILAASVSYALSVVYARRFSRRGLAPITAATGQITAAAAIVVPIALIVDQPWTLAAPGIETWGAIAGSAALSTFLAYIIYYRILATAGSVNLMLVTLLIPVTAIVLGTLVLGERLSANHFIGMAAIAIGLAVIDGRVLRLVRRNA